MRNIFREFQDLFPAAPLQVGAVLAITDGTAMIELPGGGILYARGTATVGQQVYVRDGLIESVAPSLLIEVIEV